MELKNEPAKHPMYSHKKELNALYEQSKKRQQENIQAIALGLMVAQERKELNKDKKDE